MIEEGLNPVMSLAGSTENVIDRASSAFDGCECIFAAFVMRSLLVSLLLLTTIVAGVQQPTSQPVKQQRRTQRQNDETNKSAELPSPSKSEKETSHASLTGGTTYQADGQSHTAESDRSGLRQAVSPDTWPTWGLVIVGIFGTIYAACTLKAIRHEARIAVSALRQSARLAGAAKRTAEAVLANADIAQQSADTVIRRERAWVLIERETTTDRIQDPYLPTTLQMAAEQSVPYCIFFLKNFGKTPAKITAWKSELQVSDSPDAPPDASVYDVRGIFTPYMLPQGDSVPQEARFRTWPEEPLMARIAQKTSFVWLCGINTYLHIFERGIESEHTTRFCYIWETRMNTPKPFWRIAGPSEYNKAT